ncbi:hypothetical protein EDD21DRAFT_363485 [Dissophora ornata]|nr:hypothetical protein EDD21DRAFT_363485 [Dissophora ornata]
MIGLALEVGVIIGWDPDEVDVVGGVTVCVDVVVEGREVVACVDVVVGGREVVVWDSVVVVEGSVAAVEGSVVVVVCGGGFVVVGFSLVFGGVVVIAVVGYGSVGVAMVVGEGAAVATMVTGSFDVIGMLEVTCVAAGMEGVVSIARGAAVVARISEVPLMDIVDLAADGSLAAVDAVGVIPRVFVALLLAAVAATAVARWLIVAITVSLVGANVVSDEDVLAPNRVLCCESREQQQAKVAKSKMNLLSC